MITFYNNIFWANRSWLLLKIRNRRFCSEYYSKRRWLILTKVSFSENINQKSRNFDHKGYVSSRILSKIDEIYSRRFTLIFEVKLQILEKSQNFCQKVYDSSRILVKMTKFYSQRWSFNKNVTHKLEILVTSTVLKL